MAKYTLQGPKMEFCAIHFIFSYCSVLLSHQYVVCKSDAAFLQTSWTVHHMANILVTMNTSAILMLSGVMVIVCVRMALMKQIVS